MTVFKPAIHTHFPKGHNDNKVSMPLFAKVIYVGHKVTCHTLTSKTLCEKYVENYLRVTS